MKIEHTENGPHIVLEVGDTIKITADYGALFGLIHSSFRLPGFDVQTVASTLEVSNDGTGPKEYDVR